MIDKTIPLVELHRHLDGNVRLQTILDLGHQHNIALPAWDLESLRPHIQILDPQPGIMAFIEKFHWPMAVLVDDDACRRIAYENVEDAKLEGLDYLELRFSPWFMAESHALNPCMVVEAVVDGIKAGARDFGIRVNLIGILSRTYGPGIAMKELDALLSQTRAICALDLAGDELGFPAGLFIEHFRRAREAGWHTIAHAGEIDGPDSIWGALNELGAERIGHALHAVEDPALMKHLADKGIGVEVCLTSNVQTSCVQDYKSHPIHTFIEHGIRASLNTDDPGISGIDLRYEYNVAAQKAGLDQNQIRQAQINALETAFLDNEEKQFMREAVKN